MYSITYMGVALAVFVAVHLCHGGIQIAQMRNAFEFHGLTECANLIIKPTSEVYSCTSPVLTSK